MNLVLDGALQWVKILANLDPLLNQNPLLNQYITNAREAKLGCDFIESELYYNAALQFAKDEYGEHSAAYSLILLEVTDFYEQFGQDVDMYGVLVELKSVLQSRAKVTNPDIKANIDQLTKFNTALKAGLFAMKNLEYQKSENIFRDSICLAENTWGAYSPFVGIAYCFMHELFVVQGRVQEAAVMDALSNKILFDGNSSNSS